MHTCASLCHSQKSSLVKHDVVLSILTVPALIHMCLSPPLDPLGTLFSFPSITVILAWTCMRAENIRVSFVRVGLGLLRTFITRGSANGGKAPQRPGIAAISSSFRARMGSSSNKDCNTASIYAKLN